jgi:hypothetical protein
MSDDIKKYIPFEGNDNFRKAAIVENPPVYHGHESWEILRIVKEPCHKGEAMDAEGKTYIIEGLGCPYNGKVIRKIMEITDAKGNKREREQANYYCYKCREDFETYSHQPKPRTIDEVRTDAHLSKKRHDPYVDDRTKIQWY